MDAELQIHAVRCATATEVTVVVRCLRGPVRLGARFSLVRDTRAPIDLTVTSIVRYNHPDRTVDPGHSALVTPTRHGRAGAATDDREDGPGDHADCPGRQPGRVLNSGYGNPCTCGPTVLDHALPAAASQFVDQVMAPRRSG